MNCCDDFGQCTRGPGCPAGERSTHPGAGAIAQRLLHRVPPPGLQPLDAAANDAEADDSAEADRLLLSPEDIARLAWGLLPLALCWLGLMVWLIWSRWS